MSLDIFSSNSSSSFIGGGDLVVGNPKVSVLSDLVGFRKWYAFHLTRRRKESVLSIKLLRGVSEVHRFHTNF